MSSARPADNELNPSDPDLIAKLCNIYKGFKDADPTFKGQVANFTTRLAQNIRATAQSEPVLACSMYRAAECDNPTANESISFGQLASAHRAACECSRAATVTDPTRVTSIAELGGLSFRELVDVLDSYAVTPEVRKAAVDRLRALIPAASAEELFGTLSSPNISLDQVVADERGYLRRERRSVSAPGCSVYGVGRRLLSEETYELVRRRAEQLVAKQRAEAAAAALATAQAKAAEEALAERTDANRWARRIEGALREMNQAYQDYNVLVRKGFGMRAREEAWPLALSKEQELCAVSANLRRDAPSLVPEVRKSVVRSAAYQSGDSAGVAVDERLAPYLEGRCRLLKP